ncbi:hypothetical protein [Paenibacillus glucanolyticus]|nr:hypothetical protein [Paenibacillus glucanolyticus]
MSLFMDHDLIPLMTADHVVGTIVPNDRLYIDEFLNATLQISIF